MQNVELLPDERFADYAIVRLLGRGGYADVYLAKHVGSKETVALKRLKPQFVNNVRAKERFLAEARLFSTLRHPNVVRVTRIGSEAGLVWMALEFLDGGTLREVCSAAGGPLPIVKALYFCREIADGVAAMHALRVVHRDLKPENVMVTTKGEVKVLDAGAGKFFGWNVQSTGPLGAVGTPLYMAPEHIRGEAVDARTDVYALGVILYELLKGQNPFARGPDGNASPLDIIAWQLHVVPPPLAEVVRGLPPSISALVQKATAKVPGDRHASMTEFAQSVRRELTRWIQECPGDPERIGVVDGAVGELRPPSQARSVELPSETHNDAASPAAHHADEAITVEIRREMSSMVVPSGVNISDRMAEPRLPLNGTEPIQSGPWSRPEPSWLRAPAAAALPDTEPIPKPGASLDTAMSSDESIDRTSQGGAARVPRHSGDMGTFVRISWLMLGLGIALMAFAIVILLRASAMTSRAEMNDASLRGTAKSAQGDAPTPQGAALLPTAEPQSSPSVTAAPPPPRPPTQPTEIEGAAAPPDVPPPTAPSASASSTARPMTSAAAPPARKPARPKAPVKAPEPPRLIFE